MLTTDELKAWGWRIPFVIGALAAVVAMYLRRSLAETASEETMHNKEAGSVVGLVRHHPRAVLIVLAFTMGGSLYFYTFTTYMQKYLVNTAHMDATAVTFVMTAVLIVFMLLQPVFGALSDRIGRKNNMILFTALGCARGRAAAVRARSASPALTPPSFSSCCARDRELLHIHQRRRESRAVPDRSARARGRPYLRGGERDVRRHRRIRGALAQVGRPGAMVCLVRRRNGGYRTRRVADHARYAQIWISRWFRTVGTLRIVLRLAGARGSMTYDRRTFSTGLASVALCATFSRTAQAQQVERPSLKLGVANKAHLYYLPLTLTERRGHFKDYGLTVATADFEGGGQSLEALLAGSVDVVTGAYEHTLRAQSKGQDIRAVIELGRFPGVVLAVGKDRPFKSHADLKSMRIGVTAPGSSSHFFVLYLMAKAGLGPADATFVGVGGGTAAVDAMKTGEIDAISNLDPVITRLQQDGTIRIITDTRFPRVNYEIFGGTNPAAVLYAKQEFIAANPNTMQALVNAFYKTLKWIATATTDEIVDAVPTDYFLGDRAIYVKALKANLLVYSKTGIITRQGMNSALNMLATFDPDLKGAKIDLQKTFDDRFIRRATVLFDDPTNSDLEKDERRPEIDLNPIRD